MSKFRKNKSKGMPAISTASLPDIVFTVLAFFVVVSSMKQTDLKVQVTKPSGEETIQLDKNEAIDYVAAGIPNNKSFGTTVRLQLDDQIETSFLKVREFINSKQKTRTDIENNKATVSIKADEEDVTMAEIDQIENELREVNALKINYSTKKKVKKADF